MVQDDFKIIKGENLLKLYQFHSKTAKHYFCTICGIHTHNRPRIDPRIYGINIAFVDGIKPFELKNIPVNDGENHPHDKKSDYLKFLKKQRISGKPKIDKIGKLKTFYLPLSKWIYSFIRKIKKLKLLVYLVDKAQEKYNNRSILKFIFKKKYGLDLCVFSIDDFYKTKITKKKMSKSIHPLFLTRGVPGTHDLKFLNKVIQKLKKKNFKTVLIPKFDKSKDDRFKKTNGRKLKLPRI